MAHGSDPHPPAYAAAATSPTQHSSATTLTTLSHEKRPLKSPRDGKPVGSRRIFSPQFKLQVLDSYRKDSDCRGNQRATARKYGIHRRQIQKWLQMEGTLRCNAGAAINLASSRPRVEDTQPQQLCNLSSSSSSSPSPPLITNDTIMLHDPSESEDEEGVASDSSDRALDFTAAALSRRRFFTRDFKLEVVDAFYRDPCCRGNQRATARRFGINRRQVQKWLDCENELRSQRTAEATQSDDQHLQVTTECLDLSKKGCTRQFLSMSPPPNVDNCPSPVPPPQTESDSPPPNQTTTSSKPLLLYRPYDLSPSPPSKPPICDPWPTPTPHPTYYPYYYSVVQTSYLPYPPAPYPPAFPLYTPMYTS